MAGHAYNPSTEETEGSLELAGQLVYPNQGVPGSVRDPDSKH